MADIICIFNWYKLFADYANAFCKNLWPPKQMSKYQFYSCTSKFNKDMVRTFSSHNGCIILHIKHTLDSFHLLTLKVLNF